MGTAEEAIKYLDRRFYISLTGYLCKVSCIAYLKVYSIPKEYIGNENGKKYYFKNWCDSRTMPLNGKLIEKSNISIK